MRNTFLLVMVGGLAVYLVAVVSMLNVSKRPVFETVVPKSGSGTMALDTPAMVRIDPNEAKDLPVFSSDNQAVGRLAAVTEGSDGGTRWIMVETSGFLGLGSRVVMVPASALTVENGVIRIKYSSRELEHLPEVSDAR